MAATSQYIETTVQPLMDEIALNLIQNQPQDPIGHLIEFLRSKQLPEGQTSGEIKPLLAQIRHQYSMMSEDEEDLNGLISPAGGVLSPSHSPSNIESYLRRGARLSVSAAPTDDILRRFGNYSDMSPKSEEDRVFLENALKNSKLNEFEGIVDRFVREEFVNDFSEIPVDSSILIIQTGEFEKNCGKECDDGASNLVILGPGDIVGCDAASIIVPCECEEVSLIPISSFCVVWRLNKEYLDFIQRTTAIHRREKYFSFLSEVPIFASMDYEELAKICDALKQEEFIAGQTIVNQNEIGNKFYIVESGSCVATKSYVDGQVPQEVLKYKPGDYFGELSLLHNEPRAANVFAKTDVRLLSIDRKSFKRLLGPIQEILLRNSQSYDQEVSLL
jgi:cAMP-dependent protein kinase regulator